MNTYTPHSPVPSSNEDELDLIELVRSLWRQKVLIAGMTVAAGLVACSISLAMPKSYSAEAKILPMMGSDPSASLAAGIAAQLGPMAGMLGGLSGGKSADLVEVLSSRSMTDRVISECKLDERLTNWTHRSELITKVQKMTTIVAPNLKQKSLVIKVKAPEAELASNIANAYVTELKNMLDEIGYNNATKNRKFIETQLNKTQENLAKSEEALTNYQTKNQLVSLPETVVASIRAISDLEAQRIGAEVQLNSTNEALTLIESKVNTLQADPSALMSLEIQQKTLSRQAIALKNAQQNFLSKLSNLPPKAMEFARLQRDIQVHNAVYLALTQQYESAMIQESKESDSFLPLDQAEVPHRPSQPRILFNTALGLMIGLLVGLMVGFVRDQLSRRASHV